MLQNPEIYRQAEEQLASNLRKVGAYAQSVMNHPLCIEQMYTPHQIPWTIQGTKNLLRALHKTGESVYYITIDTGHQIGQKKYRKSDIKTLKNYLLKGINNETDDVPWLGPDVIYSKYKQLKGAPKSSVDAWLASLKTELEGYSHFFSREKDSDTYAWLEELGCYSPIIHMQQVTGDKSAHLPFTDKYNLRGKIHPQKVLDALYKSFITETDNSLTEKIDSIYLTLELFSGTGENNQEIHTKVRESIKYWRRYITEDGLSLEKLV